MLHAVSDFGAKRPTNFHQCSFVLYADYLVILTKSLYSIYNQYIKKGLFPKFQLIPIMFSGLHDCVRFIALIDYSEDCV